MLRTSTLAGLGASGVAFVTLATCATPAAMAQSGAATALPSVTIDAPAQHRAKPARAARVTRQSAQAVRTVRHAPASHVVVPATVPGSLTVATAQQALREIQQTPGGVALVSADAYRNSTVSNTIKDVLEYVPGVFAQPKWGDDVRLSIRGSGLSRNFHLRGVQLYMDGIPINTSDGYGDFQEIDPTAYKYVEVFKGGNALRYGANSLGGAINFVTPTGRDPFPNGVSLDFGAFGFRRLQANTGGSNGPWDGFVTASVQDSDGFRDHSFGHSERISGNVGYQFSPDFETRFYLNANDVRQRIPGTVSKDSALTSPETAAPGNIALDQQRNIDTVRLANKTTVRFENTTVDFGLFGIDRHLMHPIFQYLDYHYLDYGGFTRVTDDRMIGGFRNRLIAGVNVLDGRIDNQQFANIGGQKGALLSSSIDSSKNTSVYVEDSFYFLPTVAAVGNAVPVCDAGPARPLSERRRSVRLDIVQSVEPEGRIVVGRRPDLAGIRQRVAQRRGAEFRRKLGRSRHSDHSLHQHPAADRDDLRDRHARQAARCDLGTDVVSLADQGRVAVPLQRVR